MPVTKATIDDTAELTTLVNSAYRGETSKKGWTTEADLLDGIRIDAPDMAAQLQDETATILKYTNDEGAIIGCVYLQLTDKNRLYLGMLSVSPGLQANGIGRQLLHEAELLAHQMNCATIFMTVITTRSELIAWYERRGYKNTGKKLPFHNDPERFGIPKAHIELTVLEKEV